MNNPTIEITTDASGNFSTTYPVNDAMLLYGIQWIGAPIGGNGLSAGAVLTVKEVNPPGIESTIFTLTGAEVNADYYPVVPEHNNTAVAQATMRMPVIYGVLKIQVSSGGANKRATIIPCLVDMRP